MFYFLPSFRWNFLLVQLQGIKGNTREGKGAKVGSIFQLLQELMEKMKCLQSTGQTLFLGRGSAKNKTKQKQKQKQKTGVWEKSNGKQPRPDKIQAPSLSNLEEGNQRRENLGHWGMAPRLFLSLIGFPYFVKENVVKLGMRILEFIIPRWFF